MTRVLLPTGCVTLVISSNLCEDFQFSQLENVNVDFLVLCSYQHNFVILHGKGSFVDAQNSVRNTLQYLYIELVEPVTSQMI